MATAAVIARILTQYSDVGSKAAQKDIARLEKKINAFGKKALKSFGLASAATAAFAVKLGVDAVKGAAADEKQQAALATALRNTTGATDAAIAANQKYLDSLELQVAIDNEKLIPALQQLVTATGDLSQAQALLSLATDVSAASGKDLSVVSAALSKAVNGNFGALTKLGLPLDANAVKSKDLSKLLLDLSRISAGQATAAANTFSGKLETLRLKFAQVSDKLGLAIMPALVLLVDYIDKRVVPMLDIWITKNEDELNQALQNSVGQIKEVVKAFEDIYKGLEAINAILPFGIGGWIKLLAILSGVGTLVTLGTTVLTIVKKTKMLTAAARGSATTVKALKTEMSTFRAVGVRSIQMVTQFGKWLTGLKGTVGIVSRAVAKFSKFLLMTPWGRVIGLAVALGTAMYRLAKHFDWFGLGNNKKKLSGAVEEADAAMTNAVRNFDSMDAALNRYRASQDTNVKLTKEQIAQNKALAAITARNAAAQKKQDEIDKKTAALKAQIEKKYKVKITDADEYEAIQLTAVQKLQAKQKEADESLKERIKLRKEELALFQALSLNAQRYTDLLAALADDKLSNTEIELLAKKWGLTVDAAKSYIYTVFAIKDEKISEDEVDKLATAWGITKAQAAQYLDFFAALNDGKLSDIEIANLMKKWGLTKEEATKYADFISKIGDGKLDDKEIENLKTKWGMTTDQVVDYIKKIGGKVDASGTILSAGDIAALGWTNALNALNAYLAALKTSSGGVPTVTPPVVVPVVPKLDGTGLGGSKTDSAASSAKSTAAAAAYAAAKAAGDTAAAAIAAAGVTPSALASQESGAIGAASIAAQLRAAEQAQKNATTLANFKAKEAADLAASNAAAQAMDYDERFRFRAAQGVMSAADGGFKGLVASAPAQVTINVAGSVTSENDLVQTVRNGLLAGQYNGQGLTLQAI
jgi:hypothetical protein